MARTENLTWECQTSATGKVSLFIENPHWLTECCNLKVNHKHQFLLEISTEHVLWPQVDSTMHGNQNICGELPKLICCLEVILHRNLSVSRATVIDNLSSLSFQIQSSIGRSLLTTTMPKKVAEFQNDNPWRDANFQQKYMGKYFRWKALAKWLHILSTLEPFWQKPFGWAALCYQVNI